MAGANLATPLYAVYAQRFDFSSLVLTAIFATYAIVLVPSLIPFGRLSDRLGRRLVILLGLAAAVCGLALFGAAHSAAWLFAARAFQGLAVGMISGAATAALAAEWLVAPRQLCYAVVLGATVLAAAFVARLPEPDEGEREPWRVQWPRVPARIRTPFARVALTAAVVWATLALFLSIVPSYAREILKTNDLALLAAIAVIALFASSGTQIAAQLVPGTPRRDQASGSCCSQPVSPQPSSPRRSRRCLCSPSARPSPAPATGSRSSTPSRS
jgi:MFS family permease